MEFEGLENERTCAVVGSAGHLLQGEYGQYIDAHDVVVRFNTIPTGSYAANVGVKTTLRFLNARHALEICKVRSLDPSLSSKT